MSAPKITEKNKKAYVNEAKNAHSLKMTINSRQKLLI